MKFFIYVDDFIIFGDKQEKLLQKKDIIEQYLDEKLKLNLRDRVESDELWIGFLGYIICPYYVLVC